MSAGSSGVLISEADDGIVFHSFADGGAPTTIGSAQGYPSMTADDASAYWSEDVQQNNDCGYVTTIYKAPLTGGTPTVLAQSRESAWGLRTHGGWIYWASQFEIYGMPRDGGAPRMVVQAAHVNAMTISGNSIYWSDFANIYKNDLL